MFIVYDRLEACNFWRNRMKALTESFKMPFLATGVLCLLFSPVVLYFSTLDEFDSVHPLAFQNVDIDASCNISEQAERIVGSAPVFDQTLRTSFLFLLQLPTLFFALSCSDVKPPILRC